MIKICWYSKELYEKLIDHLLMTKVLEEGERILGITDGCGKYKNTLLDPPLLVDPAPPQWEDACSVVVILASAGILLLLLLLIF